MILCTTTLLLLSSSQTALASTTKDTRLLQDPICQDEAWILQQEGTAGAGVYWSAQSWMFQLKDEDGDGLLDTPPGIDAMTLASRTVANQFTPMDVAFSLEGSYLNFEDGDVLRMKPLGGLEVLFSEQQFLDAIQHQSGSFDLDAVCWQGDDLWFSVKDGLQSTVLGTIEDGDILHYELALGQISRPYTEADVQAMVDAATGNTTAIGDVRALAIYPPTGELVFTIQSPTAHDASVFGTDQGGRILPGWAESDWGFQDSTELDALTFLGSNIEQPPILSTDLPYADQNSTVKIRVRHGSPQGLVKGVFAYHKGFDDGVAHRGVNSIFLDQQDHAYNRQITHGWLHPTPLDASGSGDFDWQTGALPPQYSHVDFLIQALDVTASKLSNPIIVRLR